MSDYCSIIVRLVSFSIVWCPVSVVVSTSVIQCRISVGLVSFSVGLVSCRVVSRWISVGLVLISAGRYPISIGWVSDECRLVSDWFCVVPFSVGLLSE